MSLPILSVIVPIYNGENYLEKFFSQLNYVLHPDWEFIFVNDGSVDSTLELLEKYRNDHLDYRIRVINQKNEGVSSARNAGIEVASGEYITFFDCDDEISVHYQEVITTKIDHTADLICFDYDVVSVKSVKKKYLSTEDEMILIDHDRVFDYYVNGYWINKISNSIWNKIYKCKIIKNFDIRFVCNKRIGEDLLFNFEYLLNSKKIQMLHESLYYYLINEGSAMNRYDPQNAEEILKYYDIFSVFFKKYKLAVEPYKLKLFFLYRLYPVIAHECHTTFSEGLKKINNYISNPIFNEKVPLSYLKHLNFVQFISLFVYSLHLVPPVFGILYMKNSLCKSRS